MTTNNVGINIPTTKIAGKLPDPDKNGLLAAASDLIENPAEPRLVIAVLETTGVEEDFTKQTITAKTKITRVEVISGEDLAQVRRLLLRAAERRDGRPVLPYDTEEAINAVFADLMDDGTIPGSDDDNPSGDD